MKKLKDYMIIALGALLAAFALNLFLIPYKVAAGGVSGISTVIYYLSGQRISVGFLIIIINIPLFIAGFKIIGMKFVMKSICGTVLLSVFIDLLKPHTDRIIGRFFDNPEATVVSANLMIYIIFGGALMGLGLGIVVSAGATTGGSDLLAMILKKITGRFTVGQLLLMIDTIIIGGAGIAFKNILYSMYGLIALYVSTRIIDAITEGVNFAKATMIISDKSDMIAEKLLEEMERGVTSLKGEGMYSKREKNVLLCVVNRSQVTRLRRIVREIDPNAFIIFTEAREVYGEGFVLQ